MPTGLANGRREATQTYQCARMRSIDRTPVDASFCFAGETDRTRTTNCKLQTKRAERARNCTDARGLGDLLGPYASAKRVPFLLFTFPIFPFFPFSLACFFFLFYPLLLVLYAANSRKQDEKRKVCDIAVPMESANISRLVRIARGDWRNVRSNN